MINSAQCGTAIPDFAALHPGYMSPASAFTGIDAPLLHGEMDY
jgi:hypothetical protein